MLYLYNFLYIDIWITYQILYLRYGFYGDEGLTLEQIGKRYNITRERVRQIEARALIKLRRDTELREIYSPKKESIKTTGYQMVKARKARY